MLNLMKDLGKRIADAFDRAKNVKIVFEEEDKDPWDDPLKKKHIPLPSGTEFAIGPWDPNDTHERPDLGHGHDDIGKVIPKYLIEKPIRPLFNSYDVPEFVGVRKAWVRTDKAHKHIPSTKHSYLFYDKPICTPGSAGDNCDYDKENAGADYAYDHQAFLALLVEQRDIMVAYTTEDEDENRLTVVIGDRVRDDVIAGLDPSKQEDGYGGRGTKYRLK